MASSSVGRISLRLAVLAVLLLGAFYVGRPLYWKLSATIHEIRENRQSVKEGISKLVHEAQWSVGWFSDESDSGSSADHTDRKALAAVVRRLLQF